MQVGDFFSLYVLYVYIHGSEANAHSKQIYLWWIFLFSLFLCIVDQLFVQYTLYIIYTVIIMPILIYSLKVLMYFHFPNLFNTLNDKSCIPLFINIVVNHLQMFGILMMKRELTHNLDNKNLLSIPQTRIELLKKSPFYSLPNDPIEQHAKFPS